MYLIQSIGALSLNELSSNFPMASRQLNMCKTIERKGSPLYLEVWNDNFLMVNRLCVFSLFENTLGQVGRRKHTENDYIQTVILVIILSLLLLSLFSFCFVRDEEPRINLCGLTYFFPPSCPSSSFFLFYRVDKVAIWSGGEMLLFLFTTFVASLSYQSHSTCSVFFHSYRPITFYLATVGVSLSLSLCVYKGVEEENAITITSRFSLLFYLSFEGITHQKGKEWHYNK